MSVRRGIRMVFRGPLTLPVCLFALAILLGAAAPAAAQDRSDTGRRKPPAKPAPAPVLKPVEADVVAPVFTAGGERWLIGLGAGAFDGGDLFRVETVTGVTVPWGEDGRERFSASRFTATLDPGTAITAFAGRRLGNGRWWLRGDLSRGAANVAAEALLGQGGEVYQFDRLTFLTGSLGLEARLTAWPSHPYGGLGLMVCRATADRSEALTQTAVGFQGTLGYRQRLGRGYLAIEAQMRRIGLDLNEFRPAIASDAEPELAYDPSDGVWLLELRLVGSRAW
ncbi:MAG: hypothetical protein IPO18_13420 [bacterium]|nr:hypothetical protein [bacterium]MBK9473259.1 hypothetical protein [bacterium]